MLEDIQNIKIEDYDYNLPDERIAKFPLEQRDHSKLLLYTDGKIGEDKFFNLTAHLPENSMLVFNNTKVIQARLRFFKETGAHVEVFCLEPHLPADYAMSFQQTSECQWNCLLGNAKRWKSGALKMDLDDVTLQVEKLEDRGDSCIVRFFWNNASFTFSDILEKAGELPIPPYLHRKTVERDKETYQTVYSKIKGSVAAPTAGLHFTAAVLNDVKNKGFEMEELTLHVGAGTFKPVKSETIEGHTMHSEVISIKRETLLHIQKRLGHIVAVGTTSVRTLESLYFIGIELYQNLSADINTNISVSQWMPYKNELKLSSVEAIQAIIDFLDRNQITTLHASTQIIIAPGYEFHVVDAIITNFHQPKSTLLLLISAYLKGDWRGIYEYALSHDFRFLSYGDSSLLIKHR